MEYVVLSKHNMSNDITTKQLPMRFSRQNSKQYAANYLTLVWENVPMQNDAIIKLYAANSIQIKSLGKTFVVNSTNNSNDALMIMLNIEAEYIFVEYTANNTDMGELDCFINYKEI